MSAPSSSSGAVIDRTPEMVVKAKKTRKRKRGKGKSEFAQPSDRYLRVEKKAKLSKGVIRIFP
tara:strand:- start:836 stop:1024 length:189 start_codon:yes stop_codon:yes gene_type:complete